MGSGDRGNGCAFRATRVLNIDWKIQATRHTEVGVTVMMLELRAISIIAELA
jgi:hypothetical protein